MPIYRTGRSRLGWSLAALLITLAGCGGPSQVRYPLSSSILDAAMEPRPHNGKLLDHMGVTALSGLSPINHTGVIFHYPLSAGWFSERPPLPPNTAVGIANRQTYEIIGVRVASNSAVEDVAAKLAAVQEAASNAVSATLRVADLRARIEARDKALAIADEEAKKLLADAASVEATGEANNPKADALKRQAEAALTRANALRVQAGGESDIATTLEHRINEEKEAEEELARTKKDLEAEISKYPNVLIVTWKTEDRTKVEAGVAPIAGGSIENDEAKEGFAVLGGFRVKHLFLGEDLKELIAGLDSDDRKLLGQASLPTYMLQVQKIRYVSKVDVTRMVSAFLEIDANKSDQIFTKVTTARLDFYRKAVGSLANMGNIQGAKWKLRAIDLNDPSGMDVFTDYVSAADSPRDPLTGDPAAPPKLMSIIEQANTPSTTADWTTLQATITSLGPIVSNYLADSLSDHIEPLPLLQAQAAFVKAQRDEADKEIENRIESINRRLTRVNALLSTDKGFEVNERVRSAIEGLGLQIARLNDAAKGPRARSFTEQEKPMLQGKVTAVLETLDTALCAIQDRHFDAELNTDGTVKRSRATRHLEEPSIGLIGNEELVFVPVWEATEHLKIVANELKHFLSGVEH